MLQTGLWKYLAPTSMGAGYAIAKGLLLRGLIPEEGYVTDFTMQFLAGVLIGFSLRPVARVVYWKKTLGFVMIFLMISIFGAPGMALIAMVEGRFMDAAYWMGWVAETATGVFVAALAMILLPPPRDNLSIVWMLRRLGAEVNSWLLARLAVCGGAMILLYFGLQALLDEGMGPAGFTQRIQDLLTLPPLTIQTKILLVGLHGVLTASLIWMLCMLYIRGFVEQLVVLGSLVFVLGVFAPAFANFQQINPILLVDHVFIGLCRSFLLVALAIWLFRRRV